MYQGERERQERVREEGSEREVCVGGPWVHCTLGMRNTCGRDVQVTGGHKRSLDHEER